MRFFKKIILFYKVKEKNKRFCNTFLKKIVKKVLLDNMVLTFNHYQLAR